MSSLRVFGGISLRFLQYVSLAGLQVHMVLPSTDISSLAGLQNIFQACIYVNRSNDKGDCHTVHWCTNIFAMTQERMTDKLAFCFDQSIAAS